MNFDLKTLALPAAHEHACDALVLLLPEGWQASGDDALSQLARAALAAGDLETKPGKLLQLYAVPGVTARRVLLLGCGDASAAAVRKALLGLASAIKHPKIERLLLLFAAAPQSGAVAAAVTALWESSYSYTTTKSKPEPRTLQRITLGVSDAKAVQSECANALALASGVELAREWGNRPANHATPSLLAEAAKALAAESGFDCTLHGPAELTKLGMGAFLAVAQGSAQPPRLIELRYQGAAKDAAPVVLVGKGITFDTGGISLKPGAEMDEMKFDMCGAASVLGVFRALAELKPALNVVGLIAASENMPDGQAVKPGDVVTSMSGQTIEILNTDAEGRLVLCDTLSYAARFKPAALVDIATLTGACVIALGAVRSGLFANQDALAQRLLAAGEAAQDPCWRMPLDEDYGEGLKSNFADMGNIAGRGAGAVTAAKFLQRFVGDTPWAHLDIAGTAWKSGAAKGATGRPVGLLLHYLLGMAESDPQPKLAATQAMKNAKAKAQAAAQPVVKAGKTDKPAKAVKATKVGKTEQGKKA